MSKWKRARIGDLCEIVKGETGLASATPGTYPLVATGANRRSCDSWQFDTEAVCIPLVSSTGHGKKTLNYVHYQSGKFAVGTILAAVIPKDPTILTARFLHLYLSHFKDTVLVPLMKGAANVSLPMKAIASVEIPVPPLAEQQSLIDLIFRIEDEHHELLSETSHQTDLLKRLRQSVLQRAVEGKLTADWRKQHPVVKGDPQHDAAALLAQIKGEKGRLVKDGKIRKEKLLLMIADSDKPFDLPAGWVWCRLGEIIQSIFTGPFGSMLHKSDYVSSGIPLVNPMNMISNKIVPNEKMMVSEETKTRLERYSLQNGNVVVARRGDLSKCAIVKAENDGWLCGTGSFFLQLCKTDNNYFINYFISKYAQSYLLRDSIGQTMDNLNQGLLTQMPFPLPSFAEQEAIVSRVGSLTAIINELEKQVTERKEKAQMLMQAVLRDAFDGSLEGEVCAG